MGVNLSSILRQTPPRPSSGKRMSPNAVIDTMGGNSERSEGPEGREIGHSCYANASSDRVR